MDLRHGRHRFLKPLPSPKRVIDFFDPAHRSTFSRNAGAPSGRVSCIFYLSSGTESGSIHSRMSRFARASN